MSNELTNTSIAFFTVGSTICIASMSKVLCPDGAALFAFGLGIVVWTFSGFFSETEYKYDKKRDNANDGGMLIFPMSGTYPSHNWKWWALRILAGVLFFASAIKFLIDFAF